MHIINYWRTPLFHHMTVYACINYLHITWILIIITYKPINHAYPNKLPSLIIVTSVYRLYSLHGVLSPTSCLLW